MPKDLFDNLSSVRSLVQGSGNSTQNTPSKDDKSIQVVQKTISKSLEDLRATQEALSGLDKSQSKFLKELSDKLKQAESVSGKFVSKGVEVSSSEVDKMLSLYEGINDTIKNNLNLKLGEETLETVLRNFNRQQKKDTLLNQSLGERLKDISSSIGTSAKDFLVSNASAISTQGVQKDLGTLTLGAISPELGLLSNVLSDFVDFGGIKNSFMSLGKSMFGRKDRDAKGVDQLSEGMLVQNEDRYDVEDKQHKELLEALEGVQSAAEESGGGITGFFGGKFGKMLSKSLKVAGLAGIAGTGALGVISGVRNVNKYDGQSFFGMEDGEGGILDSKSAQYGKGIAGGAATGAVLGSIIPGIGTAIGAAVGAGIGGLAVLFSDFGDDISKAFKRGFEVVKEGVMSAWNFVKSTLSGMWDRLKDIGTTINDGIMSVKNFIVDGVMGAVNFVTDGFKSVGEKVSGAFGSVKESFTAFFEGLTSLKDTIESMVSGVAGKVKDSTVGFFRKIFGRGDKGESGGGSTSSTSTQSTQPMMSTLSTNQPVSENQSGSLTSSKRGLENLRDGLGTESFYEREIVQLNKEIVKSEMKVSGSQKEIERQKVKGSSVAPTQVGVQSNNSVNSIPWSINDIGMVAISSGSY